MSNVIKYPANPSVYGTGLVALDFVISSDLKEPAYYWAGGTAGNVLIILSYLGWTSYPVARLNSDSSSMRAKADMKQWGVRLDYAEQEPTASIPVIAQEITIDKQGKSKHKFHWRNCPQCGSWLPNYKPVTLKSTTGIKERINDGQVYFFDRTSAGAIDLALHFKAMGSIVFFEPSAKGDPKHFAAAIELADIVKYSDQRFENVAVGIPKSRRPFLEIKTLGDDGLMFRTNKSDTWNRMPAFKVENVVDSCGCGDWTTAGIISKLCGEGLNNLKVSSIKSIESALKYGQALGAWNCGFEGARSGMYRMSKQSFKREVQSILNANVRKSSKTVRKLKAEYASDGLCPSCPPTIATSH